jgi:hypothetical protein
VTFRFKTFCIGKLSFRWGIFQPPAAEQQQQQQRSTTIELQPFRRFVFGATRQAFFVALDPGSVPTYLPQSLINHCQTSTKQIKSASTVIELYIYVK